VGGAEPTGGSVEGAARQLLRRALEEQRNDTHWLTREGAGHCLLQPGLVAAVRDILVRVRAVAVLVAY
jgi:hypothetical protein